MKHLFLLLILLITGCSTLSGEETFSADYLRSHIRENQTTQADILRLFGEPERRDVDSRHLEGWSYSRTSTDHVSVLQRLGGLVPGSDAVVGTAGTWAGKARQGNSLMEEVSGKQGAYQPKNLTFYFNASGTVSRWYLR